MATRSRTLALLALGLLAAGCVNPFRPATPDRPSGTSVFEDFSTPEQVLATIKLAIAAGTDGSDAYIHAFADSSVAGQIAYRAFYDPDVKTSYEQSGHTAPEPWNRQLEQLLFTYVIGLRPTFDYQMAWEDDLTSPSDDVSADTVQFHRHYKVVASTASGSTVETIAAGFADLSMFKSGGRWAISRWNDRVDPDAGAQNSMSQRRLESQTNR